MGDAPSYPFPLPSGPLGSDADNLSLNLAWLDGRVGQAGQGGGGGGQSAFIVASDNVVPVTKISNYSVTYADYGAQFDNDGATGSVTLTLPPWAAGLRYSAVVIDPQPLAFAARGGDLIAIPPGILTGNVSSASSYASIALVTSNEPGVWLVATQVGNWSYA